MDEEETVKDCVCLANRLISVLKLPLPEVSSLRNLKSNMFSMMFESIFHLPVPDQIKAPKTVEDEAHNVQAVTDAISLDMLAISLSHITGEDVMSGNVYAIYNLLEIFEGILLYMSDTPTSTQSVSRDHVIIERKTSRLVISREKESKSDDDFFETEEDTRKPTFSRRLSRSLEEISVPSGISSEGLFKKSKDSSRKIKRKTKRMPVRVSKPSSPRPDQKITGKRQELIVGPGRGTESSEDIGGISLHDIAGQRSGTTEQSISVSSELKETIPKLLKSTESEISEPELPVPPLEIKKETVQEQYARNLEAKIRIYLDENRKQRKLALRMEKAFLKTVKTPVQKKTTSVYKKPYLSPLHRRGRPVRRPKHTRTASSSQPSAKSKDSSPGTEKETAFVQELREEFPGMHLTPVTVRRMKQRYEKQLRIMHKNVAQALQRKSRSQLQVEETAKRQAILSDILRKETRQEQYKKNLNEHKEFQIRVKAAYREARQQSSRVRNYYEEFHNVMKKRLQQRNTQEEVLLRHTFEKGIDIQKEQVRELLHYVKERQEKDAADQKIYLDALENFYQTQLSLVTESLAIERCDLEQRLKAQKQVISSLKRDRRQHLKQEVRRLQDDIASDKDGFHFRELDAENYVENLRDKYSTCFARPRR